MTLTCTTCRRVNPAEATYCYHDGSLLPGHGAGRGGPVNAGTMLFPGEFVFPSGRRCRNFDELALGCVQDWPAAVELLQGGYLESFLGGIGRADLAVAARQAAQFPDRDRGLDMLLEKLPTQVIEPPRLQVEPLVINLGLMQIGEDRRFELHLVNQGMRLLYGSLTVDKGWLALGDEPGVPEKSFDCQHELVVPVFVKGSKLKADKKPQEGKITITSNGGTAEVFVRVEVPVKPFPSGVLAGARTQRQLAEMAFKKPKEAAPLFSNGDVARWYADNGWTYPVQGPAATGLAAVQQFLEACGLTTAPRVEIDTRVLTLHGTAGERLQHTLTVKAIEKKPAFAYAVSDQPWLVPQKAALSGVTAVIPVEVPRVPDVAEPRVLTAQLTVTANGRQKFIIPVRLQVTPGLNFGSFGGPDTAPARLPVPAGTVEEPLPLDDEPLPVPAAPRPLPAVPASAYADLPALGRRRSAGDSNFHAPLSATLGALLLVALMAITLADLFSKGSSSPPPSGPPDIVDNEPLDPTPYIHVEFHDQIEYRGRFGITVPDPQDPKNLKAAKRLTFGPRGHTNNTCVKINGVSYLFGQEPGQPGPEHGRSGSRPINVGGVQRFVWVYPDTGIRVIQDVSIRRADQSRKLELCLVRYKIENTDKVAHEVGLRVLLDTYIGENDGVPFTIPGRDGLCDTQLVFKTPEEIPDFIQALERPDLQQPGTVAQLTLKLHDPQGKLGPPTRVQLGAWPNHVLKLRGADDGQTKWDVPLAPMKRLIPHDSAVVIYWDPQNLAPGASREMAFAYGLGRVASTGGTGSRLALTVDGNFRPGGEFTVTAYVGNPEPGQRATLELPPGLALVEGAAERAVPPPQARAYSPVTWRVRAERQGEFELTVKSGGAIQSQKVRITAKSFLD
jgi:hypothetical protein